jgi:hypothetical protein
MMPEGWDGWIGAIVLYSCSAAIAFGMLAGIYLLMRT